MSTLEAEIAEIIERRFGCHPETADRAAREIVESGAELQRLRAENAALKAASSAPSSGATQMSDLVERLRTRSFPKAMPLSTATKELGKTCDEAADRITALEAERDRLREALKPFADLPPYPPANRKLLIVDAAGPYHILQLDFDRARTALGGSHE